VTACVRVALALLGSGALAGCSLFSSESSAPPPASCPTTAILHPLAQTAVFAPGAAHQPMGVAFYGILDDVKATCNRAGDALHVALDVVVIGERGPSVGPATSVDLQYFVAVTGPNQAILSKRSLPIRIEIAAGAKRAGVTDHLAETIPLAGRAPGDLNIILGFQQNPDVVDYYRHFRGR
jgi:hypothetical protein